MNNQNLIPNSQRSPKEVRENGRKGGKKSGQVRAERKKFNDLFNTFLDKPISNEDIKNQLKQFGFTDEECINKNAMVFAQYKEALKGSTQAFIAVRDTIGEKPKKQIEHSGTINNPFSGLSTEELREIANE